MWMIAATMAHDDDTIRTMREAGTEIMAKAYDGDEVRVMPVKLTLN
jgi:hypothetical protein